VGRTADAACKSGGGISLPYLAENVSAPAVSAGHVIAAEWSILDVRDTRMMKPRNIYDRTA
jgi:hypothetical protein